MAVTEDGTANGKLLGIVTGRDYRVSRMDLDTKVSELPKQEHVGHNLLY